MKALLMGMLGGIMCLVLIGVVSPPLAWLFLKWFEYWR